MNIKWISWIDWVIYCTDQFSYKSTWIPNASLRYKTAPHSLPVVSQSALDNLKDIAHKRTDIFGGIEAETSTQVGFTACRAE